jgi:penicillin-binding protein 1C
MQTDKTGALILCLLLAACGRGPSLDQIRQQHPSSFAWILDRHGEPLQETRVDFKRRQGEWAPLAHIARPLQDAVIAFEDKRFYQHDGVDGRALIAAIWHNAQGESWRGASTLTMQLAGLLDPQLASGAHKGVTGKWRQMWRAWQLERALGKPQILEAYLNLAPFQGEIRGVPAAAAAFFGKGADALSNDEALLLAALLPAPQAGAEATVARACRYAAWAPASASCRRLGALAARTLSHPGAGSALDLTPHVARRVSLAPGARVATTIDLRLQRHVRAALESQLARLVDEDVEDGAVLVLDNASGEVLAYIGSLADSSHAQVDGVQALRQAGSTLKPFLYALAIEQEILTAASQLDDSPVSIATPGGQYVPQNYDKHFKGRVAVRTALAGSLNVPAVRSLLLTGIEPFHERLLQLGLPLKENAGFYGYALALGSPEVNLWSLTNAYRALANGGRYSEPALLPGMHGAASPVLDPGAAFIVNDVLADRAARSVTFGLESPLATPFWSAVKTGTSKDMRDNWCVGFSQRYSVGVWVGNFDGRPMRGVSGVTGAAPVWLEVMQALHAGGVGTASAASTPAPPKNVVRSGNEWFISGTVPVGTHAAPAPAQARITYPGNGAIFALDPDIPPALQRLFFQAEGGKSARFVLDGKSLGSAASPLPWLPGPGSHTLALTADDHKIVDEIKFQVRGRLPAR